MERFPSSDPECNFVELNPSCDCSIHNVVVSEGTHSGALVGIYCIRQTYEERKNREQKFE
jgi:hypothetical protein